MSGWVGDCGRTTLTKVIADERKYVFRGRSNGARREAIDK
jgi:hypothetical protein